MHLFTIVGRCIFYAYYALPCSAERSTFFNHSPSALNQRIGIIPARFSLRPLKFSLHVPRFQKYPKRFLYWHAVFSGQ